MRILIAHPEQKISAILSFAIERNFVCNILRAEAISRANELLESNRDIKLVLYADTLMGNLEFKEFCQKKRGIPSVSLTEGSVGKLNKAADSDQVDAVTTKDLIDKLQEAMQAMLKKAGVQMAVKAQNAESEYIRISCPLLVDVGALQAPVYIRLSEAKFLKIFDQGDAFDRQDLEKYYEKKKVEYFYLKKEGVGLFLTRFKSLLQDFLSAGDKKNIALAKTIASSGKVTSNAALDVTIPTTDLLREVVQKFGVNDEVKEIVDANVNVALKSMASVSSLKDVLARLEREKDRYIAGHSTILAYVCSAMAKAMKQDNEKSLQMLIMASQLHDISLSSDKLAAVKSVDELGNAGENFTAAEIEEYMEHPRKAAELAQLATSTIRDADKIVLQHHEQADGLGFPNGITGINIMPLSALFIVAHEIVDAKIAGNLNNPNLVTELKYKYNRGSFIQVFKQLDLEKIIATT